MYDTSVQFIHTQGIQSHIHANTKVSESVSEISEISENSLMNAKLSEIRKYPTYGQTVRYPKVSESGKYPNPSLRMGKQSHEVRSGEVIFLFVKAPK